MLKLDAFELYIEPNHSSLPIFGMECDLHDFIRRTAVADDFTETSYSSIIRNRCHGTKMNPAAFTINDENRMSLIVKDGGRTDLFTQCYEHAFRHALDSIVKKYELTIDSLITVMDDLHKEVIEYCEAKNAALTS